MARGKNAAKGGNKATRSVETQVGSSTSFVAEGKGVHGVDAPNRSYAGSDAIKRGTVNTLRASAPADERQSCGCGCGEYPSSSDSVFRPGHDSKVRAMGKAIKEGRLQLAQVPPIAKQYLTEGGMLEA